MLLDRNPIIMNRTKIKKRRAGKLLKRQNAESLEQQPFYGLWRSDYKLVKSVYHCNNEFEKAMCVTKKLIKSYINLKMITIKEAVIQLGIQSKRPFHLWINAAGYELITMQLNQ